MCSIINVVGRYHNVIINPFKWTFPFLSRTADEAWTFNLFNCLQKADIILAPLSITEARKEVIDLSVTFLDFGMDVLLAKGVLEADMFFFIRPFRLNRCFYLEYWSFLISSESSNYLESFTAVFSLYLPTESWNPGANVLFHHSIDSLYWPIIQADPKSAVNCKQLKSYAVILWITLDQIS